MSQIFLVGLGGFIGAVLRYLMGGFAQSWLDRPDWPIGTLTVNVLGCFLIGFLATLGEVRHIFTPPTRLLIFTGMLGAFTTYSTFGNETITLWQANLPWRALANVGLHLFLGLGAVVLGGLVVKMIWE